MYPLGKSIWNFSPPLRKTSLAANQCYWIDWDCKLEVVRAHSPSWSSIACWDPEGREHVGNCAVSYEHEKLALFVLQGVPHSYHTRTHTHVTARSGGLMLFNRQGQALCSLRKVKKKKKDNSCFCIYALLSTDFASRAVHHPGPSASQMRPFLPADTMVANVANSPKSEFRNSTIFKMLLYLLERVFIF